MHVINYSWWNSPPPIEDLVEVENVQNPLNVVEMADQLKMFWRILTALQLDKHNV